MSDCPWSPTGAHVPSGRADGECAHCDTFLIVEDAPMSRTVEIETVGPDTGHRYSITVWAFPAVDAPDRSGRPLGPYMITIRAWSLSAACDIAGRVPLDRWHRPDAGPGYEPVSVTAGPLPAPRSGWWRDFWTSLSGRAGLR